MKSLDLFEQLLIASGTGVLCAKGTNANSFPNHSFTCASTALFPANRQTPTMERLNECTLQEYFLMIQETKLPRQANRSSSSRDCKVQEKRGENNNKNLI